MEEKIRKEIEGKNLKRVLPQVKKTAKLQKERVQVYVVTSLICAFLGVGGFFIELIPSWLKWVSLSLLPFQVLGAFADLHSYKYQKEKVKYIEEQLGI